jgi:hypothetical protein
LHSKHDISITIVVSAWALIYATIIDPVNYSPACLLQILVTEPVYSHGFSLGGATHHAAKGVKMSGFLHVRLASEGVIGRFLPLEYCRVLLGGVDRNRMANVNNELDEGSGHLVSSYFCFRIWSRWPTHREWSYSLSLLLYQLC